MADHAAPAETAQKRRVHIAPYAVSQHGGFVDLVEPTRDGLIANLAQGNMNSTHFNVEQPTNMIEVSVYEKPFRRQRTIATPSSIGNDHAGRRSGRLDAGKRTYGGVNGDLRQGGLSLHSSTDTVIGPHDEHLYVRSPRRHTVYLEMHPDAAGYGGSATVVSQRMVRGDILTFHRNHGARETSEKFCDLEQKDDRISSAGVPTEVKDRHDRRRGNPPVEEAVSTAGAPTGYLERKLMMGSNRGMKKFPGIDGDVVGQLVFSRGLDDCRKYYPRRPIIEGAAGATTLELS